MASTIRSFVAVDLPVEVKRQFGKLTRKYSARWPEFRWCGNEQLHLTLNFLGEVPDEKLPRVCEIMRETLKEHSCFQFQIGALGAFPKISRPRVIWAGVEQGKSELARIYYDLRDHLDELRLDEDRKAYRPHVTLARIRNSERWSDSMIDHLQSESAQNLFGTEECYVDVDEVTLFSSYLEKSGPTYTVMDRISLSGD